MAQSTPTFDYESEAARIARRQKLVEAMLMQSRQPLTQPQSGRMLSAVSPMEGLSRVVDALGARRGERQNVRDEEALGRRYAEDLRSGMEQFYKTSEGFVTPGPVREQIPGNRRKAVLDAMASTHPGMRQFAMQQMEHELQGQLTPKDLAGMAVPEDVLRQPGNPAGWRGKVDLKELTPGFPTVDASGQFRDPAPLMRGGMAKPPYEIIQRNGDTLMRTASGERMLDQSPRVNTTINNTPERLLNSAIAPVVAKSFETALADYQAADETLVTLENFERLNESGTFGGPQANVSMWLGQFADSVGAPLSPELRKTLEASEAFESTLAEQVAGVLTAGAGVGRSMTNEDREWFMKQFPQLAATPEGRREAIARMRASAMRDKERVTTSLTKLGEQYPEAAGILQVVPQLSTPQRRAPQVGSGGEEVIDFNDLTPEQRQSLLQLLQQGQ